MYIMRSLFLECKAGISGDMLVAAMLDMGADKKALDKALLSIPAKGFMYEISRVNKGGLDCCDFNVILDGEHDNHDHDMEYLHGDADEHDHEHEYDHEHDHCHPHSHGHGHPHVHENQKAVINRLARAIGHLQRVKRMVDEDYDCSEILIQLAAVRAALESTGKVILQDHIQHCIVDAVEEGDEQAIADLCAAIDKFIK